MKNISSISMNGRDNFKASFQSQSFRFSTFEQARKMLFAIAALLSSDRDAISSRWSLRAAGILVLEPQSAAGLHPRCWSLRTQSTFWAAGHIYQILAMHDFATWTADSYVSSSRSFSSCFLSCTVSLHFFLAWGLCLIICNLLFEDRCPALIKTSNFENKLGLNFPWQPFFKHVGKAPA